MMKETTNWAERRAASVSQAPAQAALPLTHLERVAAWGGASAGTSFVYRPVNLTQLQQLFALARETGRTIGFRGGGNSYGDAAQNDEQILIDLTRFNRVLDWNPETGRITVEPGLTLRDMFSYVVGDGWWPPVCTGTAKITIGGGAAMNVHGKNAFVKGTIGEHIYSFDLLLGNGEIVTCSRAENSDLFHTAIGGLGMLGCFTSLTLQMHRVYSGELAVTALPAANLAEMIRYFEAEADQSDYLVGWVDAFSKGKRLGRGEIHKANYLPPGADPVPEQSLRLDNQHLPDTIMGIIPKSIVWVGLRLFANNLLWRLVNFARYQMAHFKGEKHYRQGHAAFHFLLDYVPHWKKAYGSGGLIQYQAFIPRERALETFTALFRLNQEWGMPNYLAVFKKHKPDPFLFTHGLDGYSMAMDFRVTRRNREKLVAMARQMDEIVLRAGGRFYFAKDSTLRPEICRAFLGEAAIAQFMALKERCDPAGMLESNLWRRLFVSGHGAAAD
ncbi:MAG: FAD-binding oxidoreductase [Anaerolineales bacterium]|nr:FAD-binding oxidoreductase [Anaerolineales bacterium]